MARRGKYQDWLTEEGLMKIENWARHGLTDAELAKNMGISRSTLAEWRNKYPDILNAYKKGREVTNILLENALFKRALGYKEEEPEIIEEITEKDGIQTKHRKKYYKVHPPDTGAAIFLIKNRLKQYYRERPMSKEEERKLELENEHQELQNELLRRALSDHKESLKLVENLIEEINEEAYEEEEEETIKETEGVLEEV